MSAHDRQKQSLDTGKTEDFRSFCRAQAVKHAQDADKLVAMLTREESDAIPAIVEALRPTPEFQKAAAIVGQSFAAGRWGAEVLLETLRPEHSTLIRDSLLRWFGPLQD